MCGRLPAAVGWGGGGVAAAGGGLAVMSADVPVRSVYLHRSLPRSRSIGWGGGARHRPRAAPLRAGPYGVTCLPRFIRDAGGEPQSLSALTGGFLVPPSLPPPRKVGHWMHLTIQTVLRRSIYKCIICPDQTLSLGANSRIHSEKQTNCLLTFPFILNI